MPRPYQNQTRITGYFVVLTAYNEEKTLMSSFLATKRAVDFSFAQNDELSWVKIVICHNGCTDKTPQIAQNIENKFSNEKIHIEVISSEKGMILAQNACMRYVRKYNNIDSPIMFIDTDALIDEKAIDIFLKQFELHPELKVVGAHPVPIPYNGTSIVRKFLDRVLNCRGYFPKSEVTVYYAPEFHPYAETDPQPIGVEFEKHSKIYFHGRCFALRNESIWNVPDNAIAEDIFLDRGIHFRYGPGSIRVMYNAKINFYPINQLSDFSRIFFRIWYDLRTLKHMHPEFNGLREYSKTTLDWRYIHRLAIRWQIIFVIYSLTRKFYHFLYKHKLLYSGKSVFEVWSYNQKNKYTNV